MEDCNDLVADCVVISCCCQCLILQLLLFVFIHLPRKMARKTKEYAKRKFRQKRKRKRLLSSSNSSRDHDHQYEDEDVDVGIRSMRLLEVEEIDNKNNCMDEVEEVLKELSMKGEFAFGSFWGGDFEAKHNNNNNNCCNNNKCVITREGLLDHHQYQYGGSHVVKFHFIEVVGHVNSSSS